LREEQLFLELEEIVGFLRGQHEEQLLFLELEEKLSFSSSSTGAYE
jgi:hypothetical protein